MDFSDYCQELARRVANLKNSIATEEATKNAFIMPFIQMLGYDVFNPMEVIPEMDCDIAKKKGEKIDYAIMKDGEPIMLIECKHWAQDLNLHDNQLQRYYVASKAKFGVLTNGIVYRFYTDLDNLNIMDNTPFLEVDFENLKESHIKELKKFCKSAFNVDDIISTASELKYMSNLKQAIKKEFASPSADLVKLLAKRVYQGVISQRLLEVFTDYVQRALSSHINDVMSERLNVAIKSTEEPAQSEVVAPAPIAPAEQHEEESISKIVTTEEELEAYYIVKSIIRCEIAPERITYRDAQSYFSIFIDDNNRKPVCRLYLNRASVKYIAFIEDKKEVKHIIESIDDIYNHREALVNAVSHYK